MGVGCFVWQMGGPNSDSNFTFSDFSGNLSISGTLFGRVHSIFLILTGLSQRDVWKQTKKPHFEVVSLISTVRFSSRFPASTAVVTMKRNCSKFDSFRDLNYLG